MKASQDKIEDSGGQKLPIQQDVEQCAFDGAMTALVPIADAAHLIHGPIGCVGNFFGGSNNIRFTTDMEESDIIFGGVKKLYKAILEVHRRYNPSAIFVYSTCVSAMIGDDISGATRDATEELKIPVISVDSPGFIGSKKSGTRLVGDVLLESVIGTAEPELTTQYDINLIGDNSDSGAIENLQSMLEKVGIRVLAKITGNIRYQEICYAHRAKLNVVVSSKPLLKMAKQMEKRFAIPYIEGSLQTLEDTNNCLRNIAAKLENSQLQERTEQLIAEENTNLNCQLDLYRSKFQNQRIILEVGNSKGWMIISVAKYLSLDVIPISQKVSPDSQNRIQQLIGRDVICLETYNHHNLFQIIQDFQAHMLVARVNYRNIAIQAQIPFLDVNQEYPAYAGYTGVLQAVRELYAAFQSPIWKQLRKSAPWQ
ncbi:MAG: nitrogenase iron-molybdenum cofactor biosynthesis protein NifE [Calothrix sp. C42_A2020_038]|nr:nitrogenase iron-molybdenum cofactor biosynthesis protein NifE [Calothrix sp. C42_A2020_038]